MDKHCQAAVCVSGMETALSKPAVASVFMEGTEKFEADFSGSIVILRIVSRSCKNSFSAHAFYLSGIFLLGRISADTSYLKNARKNMIEMYREYRAFHGI